MRRREFLRLGALGGLSLSMPSGLRVWLDAPRACRDERRTLVLVELTGGNDGLSTFVPHGDDRYHRARPTLRIAPNLVHHVDDVMGFAPDLPKLAALFKEGGLVVVQGVGTQNPDRSHFTSLDRWHSGSLEGATRTQGWVGRGLDEIKSSSGALAGVALGERVMPRLLQHHERHALCCESLADLVPPAAARRTLASDAVARMDAVSGSPEDRKLAALSRQLMTRLEAMAARSLDKDSIPESHVGRLLGDALRVAIGDLDIRAVFVRQTGFDTHARQAQTQPRLLADLDGGLAAFIAALKRRELDQRVLVIVYSEFGRRVAENGSLGTDHGSGAPVFMAGGGLKGGLIGDRPDLADLDDGDVRATLDFRRVLAQGLKHLGHDEPARVVGAGIVPLF